MNNNEANSDLGMESRGLAYALIRALSKRASDFAEVDNLQEALFEYGKAIAEHEKDLGDEM